MLFETIPGVNKKSTYYRPIAKFIPMWEKEGISQRRSKAWSMDKNMSSKPLQKSAELGSEVSSLQALQGAMHEVQKHSKITICSYLYFCEMICSLISLLFA